MSTTTAEREHYLDHERRTMDVWSEVYDASFDRKYDHYVLRREVARLARTHLPDGLAAAQARVLDVGCGPGNLLRHLLNEGFEDLSAIDISPGMIEVAKRNFPGVRFHVGAFEDTFPDESFDVITLFSALHHFQDPMAAIRRIRTLLKPGGILLFNEPNEHCSIHRHPWLGRWIRIFGLPLLGLLRVKNAAIWHHNRRLAKDPVLRLPEHHRALDTSLLEDVAATGFERVHLRERFVALCVFGQFLDWANPVDRVLGGLLERIDRPLEAVFVPEQFTVVFRKTA